jgi:hypothetical protein
MIVISTSRWLEAKNQSGFAGGGEMQHEDCVTVSFARQETHLKQRPQTSERVMARDSSPVGQMDSQLRLTHEEHGIFVSH